MIKVQFTENKITITGHAGYAPPGQDIVCAAVSALVETLRLAVDEIPIDTIEVDEWPISTEIRWGIIGEPEALLIRAFLIGVTAVADAYPRHVKVSRRG